MLSIVVVLACQAATAPQPVQEPAPELSADALGWARQFRDSLHASPWAEVRWRGEWWDHLKNPGGEARYDYQQVRTRVGSTFDLDRAELGFEAQDIHVFGIDDGATAGPAKLYRGAHDVESPQALAVRQAWIGAKVAGAKVRAGRHVYEDNAGVKYDDPAFQYVRDRGNARFLGNSDWVAGGRSFDGFTLGLEDPEWVVRAVGFEANQGSFDVDDTGKSLDDVFVEGIELVSRRGALVPQTELRGFAFTFRDDRDVTEAKLGDGVDVQLFGAQLASRAKVGPGSADLFLWGAHEWGDAGADSLDSGAWVAEAGYRFDQVPLAPWLRVGHARAQGDGDPADGTSHDFWNGLPTNHAYYGFADLFALSNLKDSYVDLFLDPHPQVRFAATWHWFAMANDGGKATFGSGPFDSHSYGYGTFATTSGNLGRELDLTLRVTSADKKLWGLVGASRFWGSTAFDRLYTDANVTFGYVEVGIRL